MSEVQTGVITTKAPARLDRLPWSRWLFIQGHARQAEDLGDGIEERVERETGARLKDPSQSISIRQRKVTGFGTIARAMFTLCPRRTILGLSPFIGQTFLANAITFGYGNLIGPLMLGRLFARPLTAQDDSVRGDAAPAAT